MGTPVLLRPTAWLSVLAVWVAAGPRAEAAFVTSTFDSGDEGWRVRTIIVPGNNPTVVQDLTPTFVGTGGNPGGYIQTTDPDGNATVFSASAAYLGNKSAYLGGTLSWDMRSAENDGIGAYLAILVGTDRTLYSIASAGPPPTTTWGSFSLNLSPSNWFVNSDIGTPATAADLAAVLGNLQALYLRADWHTGTDLVDLDNVRLESANGVPAPPALALAGVGIVSLFGYTLRPRKR